MPKHGKSYKDARARVDATREYAPQEAVRLLKELKRSKFDETLEVHVRTGLNVRHADEQLRGTIALPHGLGKDVTVAVFAQGDKAREAEEAGADVVGAEDLADRVQNEGFTDFDVAIAQRELMGKVGRLGRVLGPRGLMPNPRSGTVVRNPEDLPGVLRELKGGRVEFRNDRTGIVHVAIGRKSFAADQLRDNLYAFVDALQRAKPSGVKGIYCRTLTLTSTMAPGVPLDVPATLANASAAAA